MNKNETLTLWMSIGAAIFAVMLIYSYTQEKSAQISRRFGAQTSVLVAVRDIGEMETINDTMVQLKEFPSSFVQPAALSSVEEAVGLVALAPISTGEQILQTKITKPGPTTGLSLQVAPGRRALTIPIDEMRGVAKLLKPGDRVDVIAALDIREGTNQKRVVRTIMQDVVILATGIKVVSELPRILEEVSGDNFIRNLRSATNFNSITVEADKKAIQNLVYVLSTSPGSLFLSLRHPSDHEHETNVLTSGIEQVLNNTARKPARAGSGLPTIRRRNR